MNYSHLKEISDIVGVPLKYSEFITNKKLEKEQTYFLGFFDFSANDTAKRLKEQRAVKEEIKKIERNLIRLCRGGLI